MQGATGRQRAVACALVLPVAGCAPDAPIATQNTTDAGFADGPLTSGPAIIADSIADFSDTTQGVRSWFYGYVDPETGPEFVEMQEKGPVEAYTFSSGEIWPAWHVKSGTYWTQLFKLGGNGNGTITSLGRMPRIQYAVRRWVSTVDGPIVLTGEVAKIDTYQTSNGIDARIEVDGVQVYTTLIDGTDPGGRAYEVFASVHVGSTVDFVIDPHDGDDQSDLSRFTATILTPR